MVNQKIVDSFINEGDQIWANCLDVIDCLVIEADEKNHRIDDSACKQVRDKFSKIEKDEDILFIRDLTFWNTRGQGCVITDRALHFMIEKDKPEKSFFLKWSDIMSVTIDKGKFLITMYDSSKHYIDTNLLMKKKDPSIKMLKRIAGFLNITANLEQPDQLVLSSELNGGETQTHTPEQRKQVGEYLTDMGKLVSGISAFENRKAAKDKKEQADKIMEETNKEIEKVRFLANSRLENFGRVRCETLKTTVGRFIKILESLNNSAKKQVYELSATLSMGEAEFKELETIEMNSSNILATATAGGGAAAVALAGVPAAVNASIAALCTASTGTAISSLSGAAATNATLAWLGGGTLAAGGGGVAAGAAVLTTITWATTGVLALASAGIVAGKIFSKKHTEAERYLADVNEWRAKSLAAAEIMKGVVKRSDELTSITYRLEARTIPVLDELESLVPEFNNKNPAHVNVFQRAAMLVKSMSVLAQTPLLDADGNLNEQSMLIAEKTQKILNHELV